jgi:tetratricopeptide (TPR) repeat protein
LSLPPSLRALVTARLDRLEPAELKLLESAAIMGQEFSRQDLATLAENLGTDEIPVLLSSLARKELVRPQRWGAPGHETFQFVHGLVQEVVYQAIPKSLRAQLHERYADVVGNSVGQRLAEYQEIVAWHLETAYRCLAEVGLPDEKARALARRAVDHLVDSGRRALMRQDMHAAENLLGRAADMLEEGSPLLREVLPELCEARMDLGDYPGARSAIDLALEEAEKAGDRVLYGRACLQRAFLQLTLDPSYEAQDGVREARQIIRLFEDEGETRWMSLAWGLSGSAEQHLGRHSAARASWAHSLEAAQDAGSPQDEARARAGIVWPMILGTASVEETHSLVTESLEWARAHNNRRLEATLLGHLAELAAMQKVPERAIGTIERAQALVEEMGLKSRVPITLLHRGTIELLIGDQAAAVGSLTRCCNLLETLGEKGALASAAALLADALYSEGRWDEAERWIGVSREAGAVDDVDAQVRWRRTAARLEARKGNRETASLLAKEAVGAAAKTESLYLRAEALIDQAEVLDRLGSPDAARRALYAALQTCLRKGDEAKAARITQLMASGGVREDV